MSGVRSHNMPSSRESYAEGLNSRMSKSSLVLRTGRPLHKKVHTVLQHTMRGRVFLTHQISVGVRLPVGVYSHGRPLTVRPTHNTVMWDLAVPYSELAVSLSDFNCS